MSAWAVTWRVLLVLWWAGALAGFVLAMAQVSAAKRARRHLPVQWKWSRVLANRMVRAGRGRGVLFTAYLAVVPSLWFGITVPSDVGPGDEVRNAVPFVVVLGTIVVWVVVVVTTLVLTVADLREMRNGDD